MAIWLAAFQAGILVVRRKQVVAGRASGEKFTTLSLTNNGAFLSNIFFASLDTH